MAAAVPMTALVYYGFQIGLLKGSSDLWAVVFTCIVQILLVMIPFRFRRLKKGMPFLLEHGSSDSGVYISISLLFAASFLGMNMNTDLVFVIPLFFGLISGLSVLFWWRNSLTKKYIDKTKAQEIESLQETIQAKDEEIDRLKRNNEELSKIIHKDNKLIPAMAYAVSECLSALGITAENKALQTKARELLEQLEQLSQERSGILKSYELTGRKLPSTNVSSIDTVLTYMFQKAKEQNISFDVTISGSVKYLVENIISESDINTLLADLIENAIIATKKRLTKSILVNIGIADSSYSIDILDSGEPFSPEVLQNIGLKRTTTHEGEGGSGSGLMTTFEILRKYQASFVLDECFKNSMYSKKTSVCFDDLEQIRIKTKRLHELSALIKREDIILSGEEAPMTGLHAKQADYRGRGA
jgi:signal transduction histidine kinase